MVHCFTGSRAELEAFLGMGLHIGITGWVADDRPERGGAQLAALLPLVPGAPAGRQQCCPSWHACQQVDADLPRMLAPFRRPAHSLLPALSTFC